MVLMLVGEYGFDFRNLEILISQYNCIIFHRSFHRSISFRSSIKTENNREYKIYAIISLSSPLSHLNPDHSNCLRKRSLTTRTRLDHMLLFLCLLCCLSPLIIRIFTSTLINALQYSRCTKTWPRVDVKQEHFSLRLIGKHVILISAPAYFSHADLNQHTII